MNEIFTFCGEVLQAIRKTSAENERVKSQPLSLNSFSDDN